MCAAKADTRLARHLSLPGFGPAGTRQLTESNALVIGAGGTGCAALQALALAGIGGLTLVDFDVVTASNLARQCLYGPADVGSLKVSAATARLRQMRPAMWLRPVPERLSEPDLTTLARRADIVLDCTDNFASRFMINRAAVAAGRTLVSGSAIRWEGQLGVFGPDYTESPCYACWYEESDESLEDCAGAGVLGPIPTMMGTLMATEAIKALTQTGMRTGITLYDGQHGAWHTLELAKHTQCSVCATLHTGVNS